MINKIGQYYSKNSFLQRLDFDIWRYIITQNFLYPHEIYGTILLINKHFNQLFNEKWLKNKLANEKTLTTYYQGLIKYCEEYKDILFEGKLRIQTDFAQSMITIIQKLSEIESRLDLIDDNNCLCNCTEWQNWNHFQCSMIDCNKKNPNFAGILIDLERDYPIAKILKCFGVSFIHTSTKQRRLEIKRLSEIMEALWNRNVKNSNDKVECVSLDVSEANRSDSSDCCWFYYDSEIEEKQMSMRVDRYKHLQDTLFLFTIFYYPPMMKYLFLIITKLDDKNLNSKVFSNNMIEKWKFYQNNIFKKAKSKCSRWYQESDYFFKCTDGKRTLVVDHIRTDYIGNHHVIYATVQLSKVCQTNHKTDHDFRLLSVDCQL